jgi:chemotaxis protein methyltransferase CheR
VTVIAKNASQRSDPSQIVPGEFMMRVDDFRRIAEMIYSDAGIYLQEAKATLVYARLAKRLRVLGLTNFGDYCELVAGPRGQEERQEMLASLTTNVTRFFREGHHFEHLKSHVLPPLLKQAARGGRIRIWSAACSSGQEPYSIALTILSVMPDAADHDIKVLATDIDPHILEVGKKGAYADSLLADVPPDLRKRYFEPHRGDGQQQMRVNGALRGLVAFRPLNLIEEWPMRGAFHAIFCRNVVIYFDEATQQRLWSKFVPRLEPGGWLYIGHSERVSGPAGAQLGSDGISTYRLKGALST